MKSINSKYAKYGGSMMVIIPKDMLTDSLFPFHPDDDVTIEIVGNKLVISKRLDSPLDTHIQDFTPS